MKVICKPVNAPAYDAEMTWNEVTNFVDGWLEETKLDRVTSVVYDADSILKCLPGNCAIEGHVYHGNIVICGIKENGYDVLMTADEAMMIFPGLQLGYLNRQKGVTNEIPIY